MNFTRDYSWSGVNYVCPPGLPTIGTTTTSKSIFPGVASAGASSHSVQQNRDFGDRWFRKPFFKGDDTYVNDPVATFDHRLSTYPDLPKQRRSRTPRVAKPGYYNPLERDLYGWPQRAPRARTAPGPRPGYTQKYQGNTHLSPYGTSDYGYTPYDFRPVTSHIRD